MFSLDFPELFGEYELIRNITWRVIERQIWWTLENLWLSQMWERKKIRPSNFESSCLLCFVDASFASSIPNHKKPQKKVRLLKIDWNRSWATPNSKTVIKHFSIEISFNKCPFDFFLLVLLPLERKTCNWDNNMNCWTNSLQLNTDVLAIGIKKKMCHYST